MPMKQGMDVSTLHTALGELEASWASLDWWLNFWTVLVVVGVALELLVLVTEYLHGWRDFERGTIHSPERPSIVIFGIGFLGAALVALGVAGEFRVHVKAGKIEVDMRNNNENLVVALNRASTASLDKAKEEAGIALEKERQKTARFQRENIAAQKQLANQLAATATSASESAANLAIEQKKRLFLAASLLPRKLFDQAEAIAKLSRFPPMEVIFEFTDEREPRAMAEQINFVFDVLHWKSSRKRVPEALIVEGIYITPGRELVMRSVIDLQPESPRNRVARGTAVSSLLRDCVKESGIDVDVVARSFEFFASEGLSTNTLLVMVGPKPNHALEETLKDLGPVPWPTKAGGIIAAGNRAVIREPGNEMTRPR